MCGSSFSVSMPASEGDSVTPGSVTGAGVGVEISLIGPSAAATAFMVSLMLLDIEELVVVVVTPSFLNLIFSSHSLQPCLGLFKFRC